MGPEAGPSSLTQRTAMYSYAKGTAFVDYTTQAVPFKTYLGKTKA